LLRGDRRALYLGWLAGVASGEVDESSLEPEPPPGLSRLTGAQLSLVEFLEIDPDLLTAAASTDSETSAAAVDFEREMSAWLDGLSSEEARSILKQLLQGESQLAERQLKARFYAWQRERAPCVTTSGKRRSVAELRELASEAEAERLKREAEELARLKAEQRRRREAYLATLAADFERCWQDIDQKAERGIASAYEEATRALADLAEAYTLHANRGEFDARLHGFMERHGKRTALGTPAETSRVMAVRNDQQAGPFQLRSTQKRAIHALIARNSSAFSASLYPKPHEIERQLFVVANGQQVNSFIDDRVEEQIILHHILTDVGVTPSERRAKDEKDRGAPSGRLCTVIRRTPQKRVSECAKPPWDVPAESLCTPQCRERRAWDF
jgi:hypothetical protein